MTVPTPFVYNAKIVSVVDGDTVNVVIDRGMYEYAGSTEKPIPVRILGINAREHDDPGGPEAKANLEQLLPVGSPVVLKTAKPDKYAPRWDAGIETPTIADLSAYLVEQQWAAPYNGSGPKPVPPWPRTI